MKTLSPPPLLFPSALSSGAHGDWKLRYAACILARFGTGNGYVSKRSTAGQRDVHLHASTGPILLSVNPFYRMGGLHLFEAMWSVTVGWERGQLVSAAKVSEDRVLATTPNKRWRRKEPTHTAAPNPIVALAVRKPMAAKSV